MSRDAFVEAGALALYRSEMCHRVAEFEKTQDSAALIANDFADFRAKYVRKFQDIVESLESQGLVVESRAA
ncbi:hypothetical protein [Inquilinus sp. CAU 1745]|uniref:hypothetical protein n=1 Tax=Inquilinus sp. CAU 1745 TaxID=3140369 RepID=UPI00325BD760